MSVGQKAWTIGSQFPAVATLAMLKRISIAGRSNAQEKEDSAHGSFPVGEDAKCAYVQRACGKGAYAATEPMVGSAVCGHFSHLKETHQAQRRNSEVGFRIVRRLNCPSLPRFRPCKGRTTTGEAPGHISGLCDSWCGIQPMRYSVGRQRYSPNMSPAK